MNQVSVILCCYNGRSRLKPTIEHLLSQKTNFLWELVFVDNASTDGSAEFVQDLWDEMSSGVGLRIVSEKKPGLVHARKCGVRAAKGKYIIFCDDDNWLREDYVQTAHNIMEKMPNVGVLGGQSVLASGITPPEWWDRQQGNYAVGKQLPQSGIANERGFLYGAGMVTRTELAKAIFDDRFPFLKTGRKGNQCLSGEDGEYCVRVLMIGFDLYYSEDLFYWHDILPSRLTKEQLCKLLLSFEEGADIDKKYAYAMKYVKQNRLSRIGWLIVRVWKYCFASSKSRVRKKELLYFHAYLMGFVYTPDNDFDVIKRFMLYAKKHKLQIED